MNAKSLKNSILQWAIEGKLVPQDPNDEPAMELLKRINPNIKPITGDTPFEIHEGWVWVKLKDIFTFINGDRGKNYPAKSKLSPNGEIPFISAINMDRGTVKENDLLYISEEHFMKLRSGKLQKNDIVVCIRGSLGKFCIYPYDIGAIASSLVILRKRIEIEDTYISSYLLSNLFFQEIIKYNNGTAQPNLGAKDVAEFLIPLPPLAEQGRIVAKLEELLPLVESYGKAQEGLDKLNGEIKGKLRASILQEAISGTLVTQDPNEEPANTLLKRIDPFLQPLTEDVPFEIPKSWVWCRLKDLVLVNPKNECPDDVLSAFIPMEKIEATYGSQYTYEEVKWGTIKKAFTHFANGDVAIAKITPCFQNRKSVVFENLPNGIGAGTTEIKVLRPNVQIINRWFLLYFLKSTYLIEKATFKGTANQQRIAKGYLEDKLFPLPPLAEQQRIVARIEELFGVLDNL